MFLRVDTEAAFTKEIWTQIFSFTNFCFYKHKHFNTSNFYSFTPKTNYPNTRMNY